MVEMKKPKLGCICGENYAKYTIIDLEKGYGITLGNSLKRILTSSLPGYKNNPVTKVEVDVGDDVDSDKLILKIWTNGDLSPKEAFKLAAFKLKTYMEVFEDLAKSEKA